VDRAQASWLSDDRYQFRPPAHFRSGSNRERLGLAGVEHPDQHLTTRQQIGARAPASQPRVAWAFESQAKPGALQRQAEDDRDLAWVGQRD
jgi:hypothetical protein